MKVLYSQLKKYLPSLKAGAREVAQAYTLTGFMIDKFYDIEYMGKKDSFLDLEVRQNRADAFGVIGLARELSAYYNIPLVNPEYRIPNSESKDKLLIEIKTKETVKRVTALKIANIKISEAPDWIKEYLKLYDINSINNLVDITNYVMLETGVPSHAFDTDLIGDKLVWEIDPKKYKKIVTLNGDELELTPETLVISDGERALSLSFIGGKIDAINNDTKNVIVEMGIYNSALVRRNSRQLKVITEASSRLEKYIDPEVIPDAFSMLISMIIEYCGGEIVSEIYDEYIQKTPIVEIEADLDKVQQIAGIPISYEESENYLKRLGFKIVEKVGISDQRLEKDKISNLKSPISHMIKVIRPINRLDIEIQEDIFEEIIRLKGFNNIPYDKLYSRVVKNITPSRIKLMEQIQNILSDIGFDEVRSWVLVDSKKNREANASDWEMITVTNSINEEVPYLRQSIAVSLLGQLETYEKNNIEDIVLFEIGKIFGDKNNKHNETNSLGMITNSNNADWMRMRLEQLIRKLGMDKIIYKEASRKPESAHPSTAWDIHIAGKKIGIIYVTNKNLFPEAVVVEVDVDVIDEIINNIAIETAKEVTQKIVTLDANVEAENELEVNEAVINLLNKYEGKIWRWKTIDRFKTGDKIRYTIRVSYIDLTDPEAKELHAKIFL